MKKLISLMVLLGLSLTASAQQRGDWRNIQLRGALEQIGAARGEAQYLSQRYRVDTRTLTIYLDRAEDKIYAAMNDGDDPDRSPGVRIEMYNSDSCSSDLVGYVTRRTDCDLDFKTGSVWGIKIDGRCHNIADTSAARACRAFQNYTPRSTLIYNSDSCSRDLIAAVDRFTDCESLRGMAPAWGIQRAGATCQNIDDMDIVQACQRFR